MLFAAGNPLDLEQQQVAGCCLGPGGRHSGLRRGLPRHFIGGHGRSRFRELGSFLPGGPWLHFASNDKAAVDWPPSSRGNRIHDTLAVGVSLGAAGFGARRAGRAGGSLGTERNQGHTLISAQRRGAASSHEVHEETLGRLGASPWARRGCRLRSPGSLPRDPPGVRGGAARRVRGGPWRPWSRGGGRCPPLLPRMPPRPAPHPQRLPPPRGRAGWRPSALSCFLLSRRDDGGRVLGDSSTPRDAAGRNLPLPSGRGLCRGQGRGRDPDGL